MGASWTCDGSGILAGHLMPVKPLGVSSFNQSLEFAELFPILPFLRNMGSVKLSTWIFWRVVDVFEVGDVKKP